MMGLEPTTFCMARAEGTEVALETRYESSAARLGGGIETVSY
jgi:hypothetical protein